MIFFAPFLTHPALINIIRDRRMRAADTLRAKRFMQEKTASKRLDYIDALKGFTIICVVLGHIGNGYMWGDMPEVYFYLYNITNAFHMALFMMLSGFVFAKAYCAGPAGGVRMKAVFRQVINLAIIYLIWSLILGFVKLALGSVVNEPVTWKEIAMIPIKPIQLYWYLFVLIIFYMIFAFLRKSGVNIYILLGAGFVLCIASLFVPPLLIFDVKRLMYYSFFFALGMLLEIWQREGIGKVAQTVVRIVGAVLAVLAIVFSIVFWSREVFLNDRLFVNIVIALGASLMFYFIFEKAAFIGRSRFLGYLGRHSLEIYLIHTFIITVLRVIYSKTGVYNSAVIILSSLVLSVGLPLLISFVFRKIKIYNIFFAPVKLFDK